ncbi:sphingomyelin phosphodiesterase 4, neutral membrane (neutral sphingomyelinase-3) [Homalodisca vitripennis]|nr:sphingomyelin phosphodiesterase 4, neutral membrane (neutral sphingomyelinase-3) [Homalodisca vitripennis]
MPVDSRWLPFIAENLLVYSVIFHQLIERFKMLDLASARNAYMLFRLTKVFSQPNLSELLRQVEGSLVEMDGRGYSKWVQSHLVDLEGPTFQYKPILASDSNIQAFIRLVKEAELQAVTRLEEELRKDEQMGFWERLFSGGGSDTYTLAERKNVPIFLSASIKNFISMFQIPEDSVDNVTRAFMSTPRSSRPASINEFKPGAMGWSGPATKEFFAVEQKKKNWFHQLGLVAVPIQQTTYVPTKRPSHGAVVAKNFNL